VPARGLIDTGPILALLDRNDPWHRPCVETMARLRLPLLTSAAVLTEVFHMVPDGRRALDETWAFIRSGAIAVASIADDDLPFVHALMVRYHDRPMDFADATLVRLAQRESLTEIFTIDHDDFETYRIEGRRRFRLVPDRRALTP
jgi:predicted nucleic acid-binding protein